MNKEIYRILKEISSLDQKSHVLEQEIENQKERLKKIDIQTKLKKEALDQKLNDQSLLKKDIQVLENEYQELSKLKEDSEAKLNHVTTEKQQHSLQEQINTASEKIDHLDNSLFEKLESLDSLDQEINELQQFIQGVSEGRKEIEDDIEIVITPKLKQISSYQSRIESLFKELPQDISESFSKLRAKALPKGPLTFLTQDNYCQVCGSQVSAPRIKEIESSLKYSTCSTCTRVIIPHSTQYL